MLRPKSTDYAHSGLCAREAKVKTDNWPKEFHPGRENLTPAVFL